MARLPQPGSDSGSWGGILNDFLSQAHKTDGALKDNIVTAAQLAPNAVDVAAVGAPGGTDGQVLTKDSTVTGGLAWSTMSSSGSVPDATATTTGLVRLAGDLTGTASAPLVAQHKILGGLGGSLATGTVTNDNIHVSAAIAKSKLAPLAVTDADISVSAAIAQTKIQNLASDLAGKAPLSHTHAIADVTGLQTALNAKAASAHTHAIADTTNLQTTLDGKANTSHTHAAGDITGLATATAAVIGDRVQAGSNVTVDYDAGTGVTTISATGTGGNGEPSDSVLTVAGRTGDVVLGAGDIISGTLTTNRIPNLDAAKVTSGTFDIGRIPTGSTGTTVSLGNHTHAGYAAASHAHIAADVTSGTLDIARIPTGTSGTTVALGNHTHSSYAALSHTHDDRYYTETEMDASLSAKLDASQKGANNGLATLDSSGKIPALQLPSLAISDVFTVASQAAMLALTAQRGDMAIRTDNSKTYVLATDSPTTLADWKEITSGTAPVTSVAGRTGAVTLAKADVGLGNVDNTSDANKPISTAVQGALDGKPSRTEAQLVVRWSGTAWPARPAGAAWGVLFLSTNDPTAPAPNDVNLANGDIWRTHPDAQ